ncbi:hypothetical protein ON010_g9961 [Phytophthora cinnamomi]|nr:hypothetical protein ON010_g9961 [Phytophthora cinnamomi]
MTDIILRVEVVEDESAQKDGSASVKNSETSEATPGFPATEPVAPPSSPVAKILFLDGVRGAAVIFVVTQHSGYMHDIYMGAVGVDAFFVLSSFLLTMIFMKKGSKLLAEQASCHTHLPPGAPTLPHVDAAAGDLVLFYSTGVRPSRAEDAPVLVDVVRPAPLSQHLPTFIAGSMAAVIYVKLEALIKNTGFKFGMLHIIGLRLVEAVLIAAYLSVVFRGLFFNWFGMPLEPETHYIMPFTSVKLSLLFVIEMVQPSTVSLIFEWVVLRYLGKISFSVYLLHVFVIFTPPIKKETNYYDKTFAIFSLVILLATISYYLIEYPSQLLAQRLSRTFNRLASNSPDTASGKGDTTKSSLSLPQLGEGNEDESESSTTKLSIDEEMPPSPQSSKHAV